MGIHCLEFRRCSGDLNETYKILRGFGGVVIELISQVGVSRMKGHGFKIRGRAFEVETSCR